LSVRYHTKIVYEWRDRHQRVELVSSRRLSSTISSQLSTAKGPLVRVFVHTHTHTPILITQAGYAIQTRSAESMSPSNIHGQSESVQLLRANSVGEVFARNECISSSNGNARGAARIEHV
jgi:hypothetical protein